MGSYQVQSGDNLWKIVKDTFKLTDAGKINEKVKEIAELNNIKNINSIFIGQKLNLGQTEKTDNKNPLPETATRSFDLAGTLDTPIKKEPPIETQKEKPLIQKTTIRTTPQEAEITAVRDTTAPTGSVQLKPLGNQYIMGGDNFKLNNFIQNKIDEAQNRQAQVEPQTQPSSAPAPKPQETASKPQQPAENTQTQPENTNNQELPFATQIDFMEFAAKNIEKSTKTEEEPIQVPLREGVTNQEIEEDPLPRIKSKGLPDFLKVNPDPIKTEKITLEQYSNISVTKQFTGTADDINKHLNGVLKGQGEKFIEMQEKYGINAAFLAGIVMNESRNGTSDLALYKNNVGGVRYPGSYRFKKYDDVGDCIEHMAKFLTNSYVKKGKTTVGTIGATYCPVTDKTDKDNINRFWPRNVGYNMVKIDPNVLA